MNTIESGIASDPLAVGLTRPAMRWGVTYAALVVNAMLTMEIFLVTHNLLALLGALPIHGICMLLCTREPRWFELMVLWAHHRLPALARNYFFWRASTYSPLRLQLPRNSGRARRLPEVLV
jgi:type IV secretion system protein VirB3